MYFFFFYVFIIIIIVVLTISISGISVIGVIIITSIIITWCFCTNLTGHLVLNCWICLSVSFDIIKRTKSPPSFSKFSIKFESVANL